MLCELVVVKCFFSLNLHLKTGFIIKGRFYVPGSLGSLLNKVFVLISVLLAFNGALQYSNLCTD